MCTLTKMMKIPFTTYNLLENVNSNVNMFYQIPAICALSEGELTRCPAVKGDSLYHLLQIGWGVQPGDVDESLIWCSVLRHFPTIPHPCT